MRATRLFVLIGSVSRRRPATRRGGREPGRRDSRQREKDVTARARATAPAPTEPKEQRGVVEALTDDICSGGEHERDRRADESVPHGAASRDQASPREEPAAWKTTIEI